MIWQFLKCFKPTCFLPFFQWALCVGPCLSRSASLQLFLSLHFLLVQSLKAKHERLGLSQIFLGMCPAFWIPRNMSEIFKAPYGHLISQIFLWSVLPSLLLAQLQSLPLEIAVLNNCHWFWGQTPWWEHFPYWKSSKTDEIKISSMNETFPESTSQSNSDTSLRTRLLRGLQTYLPVPMAARLLAFIATEVLRLLISKATMKLRRGYGNRTKHQKAYCSYKDSPTFLKQISLRLLQTFG